MLFTNIIYLCLVYHFNAQNNINKNTHLEDMYSIMLQSITVLTDAHK